MSSSTSRVLKLKSRDGEVFEVAEAAALLSETIKTIVKGGGQEEEVLSSEMEEFSLPNVDAIILRPVLEWCIKHSKGKETEEGLKKWDAEFLELDSSRGHALLYNIILAADYLEIKELLDQATQKVADLMKGKTPQEIRDMFSIENDVPPELEEQVRRENPVYFDF